MGRIVLEGIDDVVIDRLARLAESNSTSLEEQVRSLLAQATPRPDRQNLVRLAEAIAAMTPADVVQTDSVALLREDRDR